MCHPERSEGSSINHRNEILRSLRSLRMTQGLGFRRRAGRCGHRPLRTTKCNANSASNSICRADIQRHKPKSPLLKGVAKPQVLTGDYKPENETACYASGGCLFSLVREKTGAVARSQSAQQSSASWACLASALCTAIQAASRLALRTMLEKSDSQGGLRHSSAPLTIPSIFRTAL